MDYGVALQADFLATPSSSSHRAIVPASLVAAPITELIRNKGRSSQGEGSDTAAPKAFLGLETLGLSSWLLTCEHRAAMAALGLKAKAGRGMTDTLTDQVLVERAKRGDEIAFSELVTRHYRRALRVAYGLLRNNDDAQDVTQDAFARVHARLRDFEGTSAFYTWLYRIVVNLSIDAIRKRRRERRVDLEDEAAREALKSGDELWPRYDESDPGEAAERGELAQRLKRAFGDLPEIHQAVILLRELQGMSYEEIARALKIKKGTVMSRLFHARRSMQVSFAQTEHAAKNALSEGER